MRSKYEIGIRALLYGLTIEVDGRRYRLFKPGEEITTPSMTGICEDDFWLGVEVTNDKNEISYCGVESSFTSFLKRLNNLDEDTIIGLCANMAIGDYNKERK